MQRLRNLKQGLPQHFHMSPELVFELRQRVRDGEDPKALAEEYSISASLLQYLLIKPHKTELWLTLDEYGMYIMRTFGDTPFLLTEDPGNPGTYPITSSVDFVEDPDNPGLYDLLP